jgi:outer membrane protein assembly factor BamD
MQYPDSKLIPEAKQRLLEVQEVLAEREFNVGRFYYIRQSYPAAIARLESLVDKYPLYSKADDALYLLGQSYEAEIAMMRARPLNEAVKARMIADFTKGAAQAYDRILTRYPMMDRADDAKARLIALKQPVPRPTKAAVAENKAEEASRHEPSTLSKVMGTFEKHPNTGEATKVGEPTLVDPPSMSATQVVQQATRAALGTGGTDSHSVSIETVNGAPGPDQPAPRSDAPAPAAAPAPDSSAAADAAQPATAAPADPNELKPNVPADPNELKPNVSDDSGQALPPPQQVNEIQSGTATGSADASSAAAKSADPSASSTADQADDSDTTASSKHKKKQGIHKIVPF